MYYLIYVSRSVIPPTQESLLKILDESVANNEKLNVTGILVNVGDRFIQMLEGEQQVVDKLYQEIRLDDRHTGVRLLFTGFHQGNERFFNNWSMAFKQIDNDHILELTGYRDLESLAFDMHINDQSHPALVFLKHFTQKSLRPHHEELRMR